MRRDLCCSRPVKAVLFKVVSDLLTSWAGGLQIFARVTPDFRLAASSLIDFVAQFLQTQCQFGAINRSPVLLRAIEFARLQCATFAVLGFCEVEEHDMSM